MATGPWGGTFNQRVFRANVLWDMAGQQCMTGFHLRDVGINTLSPAEVATEVTAWAQTQFIKVLHNSYRLKGVDVVNLVTKEGHSTALTNVLGVVGGESAPTFITVPLSLKGGLRRRYANGRMLWPICGELDMLGNIMAPAAVTRYTEAIDNLLARFLGPSITTSMHLVHLHGDLPAASHRPAVPATWYDITTIRLNTNLSSLRRRKVGVGS